MGIVRSQSIKNLIITYVGFAVGAVNAILFYPHFLGKTYYGIVMAVLAAGSLLSAFVNLGMPDTLIKFFSNYKTREEQKRLLGLALITPLFTGGLVSVLSLLFYEFVQDYFAKSPEMKPFVWLIFVISITEAYFNIFFNWGRIKFKSVFGNFMREVFHRLLIMILLVLVYYNFISPEGFIYTIAGIYVIRMLAMMVYAFYLLPPDVQFKMPHNFSRVLKYSILILIAGLASNVLLELDKTMIPHFMSVGNVSVYAIAVFIVTVIEVPVKAMRQITHPLTARLLNDRKWNELGTLYKKSSITLYVVSGFLFALIIANVNQFYEFLSPEYHIATSIVVVLGLIKLSRNMLGIGGSILKNSDYYRLLLICAAVTVILAFVLNYLMIPAWGLYGAAIASLIAYFTYDILKVWFVFRKFKMHPFSSKTWTLSLFILIFCTLFYFLNFSDQAFWGIAIKSIIMTIVYVLAIYYFNFSDDLTVILQKFLKRKRLK